jgi:hypothetical protein
MNPLVMDPWIAKNPGPFRVGDRVSYEMLDRRVEGIIVEDRGNLGVGGMRIYGLHVRQDEWNEIYTERRADDLQLLEAAPVENGKARK